MDRQCLYADVCGVSHDGRRRGDRFGRRRVFIAGLGLFVAASAGCALAPGIGWLIAARAVQGIGAAIVMPLALAQLGTAFAPERRAFAFGVYSGVTALSSVLGPAVGGVVTQYLSWPWIFWLNVPLGITVMYLSAARLRESFGPRAGIDILVSSPSPAACWAWSGR